MHRRTCRVIVGVTLASIPQTACLASPSSLEQTTPISTTSGSRAEIEIATERNVHRQGDTLKIVLTNSSDHEASYYEGPGCGISFQRRVDGMWKPQVISTLEETRSPCDLVTLDAHDSGTVERVINLNAPPGVYRVVFQHDNGTVYSGEFIINS